MHSASVLYVQKLHVVISNFIKGSFEFIKLACECELIVCWVYLASTLLIRYQELKAGFRSDYN